MSRRNKGPFHSSPFPLHFGQLTSPDPWHLTQSVSAMPADSPGDIRPVPSHFGHSIVSSPLHFGQVSIHVPPFECPFTGRCHCPAKTIELDGGINRSASLAGRTNDLTRSCTSCAVLVSETIAHHAVILRNLDASGTSYRANAVTPRASSHSDLTYPCLTAGKIIVTRAPFR
jgi:hypothetical protein